MTLNDTGDVVKNPGFVCLNAAYLEEAIDLCFDKLRAVDPKNDPKWEKWPTSRKVEYCETRLRAMPDPTPEQEIMRLADHFSCLGPLLERRNEIVHGRIYAQHSRPDILRSARTGRADRDVTSKELVDLANTLAGACHMLLRGERFAIPKALAGARS